jgi:hypothetical protein
MIDLHEDLVTLTEATKVFPRRNGKRVHFTTVLRWCKRGIRGVKLESCRVGGTLYTSHQSISRFVDALSGAVQVKPSESEQKRAESACRVLKQHGV